MSGFVFTDLQSALVSGGDSRLRIDPESGLNKYLCPAGLSIGIVCASSCTASPITQGGFDAAVALFDTLSGAASAPARDALVREQARATEAYLLRYFSVDGLAEAILCPSGTDAVLTAAQLLAAERPAMPMTAILPSACETGTGVPLAATGRAFDGPRQGHPTTAATIGAVEVALRARDGAPLPPDQIDAAYAAAAAGVRGRAVVYLTYGSKTGLIAPWTPPTGADVIVDACQARIDPACVAGCIRRGWPVVVTGSKFFGGPAFSGAVLFPVARGRRLRSRTAGVGTVLRWTAALDSMQRFSPVSPRAGALLKQRVAAIGDAIAANPELVPIAGLTSPGSHWAGSHWADRPSIVTFAVRDAAAPETLLPVKDLRPIHEGLARRGILLGQPVDLGGFGGLRIALGARDVIEELPVGRDRLLAAIRMLGRGIVAPPSELALAAE